MTMNSRHSFPQWDGVSGACDQAKTSPCGANSARSWGSRKHFACGCGSEAARRIGRWRQSPQCPSPGCPSPWGAPGWLWSWAENQSSHCRAGDGCCVWVRVGFWSCSASLFQSIDLRHWLLHASRGFWIAQGLFYLWVVYWLYSINSIMGHRRCSVFATLACKEPPCDGVEAQYASRKYWKLTQEAAQAQHQLSSLSTVNTPLLPCRRQCQRRHLAIAPNLHAERSSLQTAGDLNISNYTILNSFKLPTRRIWLFTARPDALTPLSIVNSMLTWIQLKTGTRFPTLNTLKSSQTQSLNLRHLLWHWWKYTPAPALRWSLTLLSHGNATLTVALRRTYKIIPTTHWQRVKSTNISSVGSRWKAWRRTMTTRWRKKSPLCISQASKMGIASKSSGLAFQMIRLLGRGNYTRSRIWDGMTMTNALSNIGVETSSKAWDDWWESQPMLSISFTPLSIALTEIRHRITSIPKCTPRTGGGRHW